MSYRLLALDLDGTLLDEHHCIPESTSSKLRQAVDHGVVVTLATGRMWPSTKAYAQQLSLTHPLIAYNGALMKDLSNSSEPYAAFISIEVMGDVMRYCKRKGLYLQLYGDGEIIVEKKIAETEIDPDLQHAPCREVFDFNLYLESQSLIPTPKMMIAVTPDRIAEIPLIQEEVRRDFPGLNVVQSRPYLLELLGTGVSKGHTLSLLAERLGIGQHEVIAVGDGDNDISMVEWAGLGVAVQNASRDLIAAADYVTKGASFLGVEEVVDKFILLRE